MKKLLKVAICLSPLLASYSESANASDKSNRGKGARVTANKKTAVRVANNSVDGWLTEAELKKFGVSRYNLPFRGYFTRAVSLEDIFLFYD